MRVIAVVVFVCIAAVLFVTQTVGYISWPILRCYFSHDVAIDVQHVIDQYNIIVVYDEKAQLPQLWTVPPANGTVIPIKKIHLCRFLPILSVELAKYPAVVLQQSIKAVLLFDSMELFGVAYGGTLANDTVYLTVSSVNKGYSAQYLAELIHHEFSSVFLAQYDFALQDWLQINPSGFTYAQSDQQILQAIADNAIAQTSDALYQAGFLSAYGRTTVENDFNLYAEMLFTRPERLKELTEQYPRVAAKAQLVKTFYRTISPDFIFVD